ncbi:unnamed protein product [Camellia sinensis]
MSSSSSSFMAVKCILRYLKHTSSYGLLLCPTSLSSLHAFCDADWAGSFDDCKSTGGYAIFLGSNLVFWSSCKQHTVARSSTEFEYKALADASAELSWLQAMLLEIIIYFIWPMDPESLGNTTSKAPRKVRFAPKGPPRRVQKPVVPKIEKTETIDADAQAQELLRRFNEASAKVKPKVEKKEKK